MRALVLAQILATGLTAALAGVAQAASIAYEGIPYPVGALNGRGPGGGFAAAWTADAGVNVVAAGLTNLLALPVSGGAVAGQFNFQAGLLNLQAPAPGKEFWGSFLIQHNAPNDQTFMGLSPAGSVPGTPPSVGFGIRLGQYGIFVGSSFFPAAIPLTPAGSTDLLVMHWATGGALWNVKLFVNGASALAMSVAPVTYGTMVNQNQTGFESDEFRLGDTVNDVAAGAVPTKQSTWSRLKQLYR